MESEPLGTSEFPKFIYVSELLRTWETAVLLFLNKDNNTDLTLYISPYLRESGTIDFTSDRPGELKEQFREFIRFIHFLRELKTFDIHRISELIPDEFSITLKHFSGSFTNEYIQSIQSPEGIQVSIDNGSINISITKNDNFQENNQKPKIAIMANHISEPTDRKYFSYTKDVTTTPELTFPPMTEPRNIGDMITPSEPPGSLADFVEWYKQLEIKPHGDESCVYFVSHSGTMKTFLKKIIKDSVTKPSEDFKKEYDAAIKTNTWSLFFKTNEGNMFKGFRHAYSCDNLLMDRGVRTFFKRFEVGDYTNLALWGILSTLYFSAKVMKTLVDDAILSQPGLKISRGMETEDPIFNNSDYDSVNTLCGQQRDRMPTGIFSLSLGHCGTMEGGWGVTLDKDCIRIVTDPKGRKVVLYLDKNKKSIQARLFESAETSTKYTSAYSLPLQMDTALNEIIKWLFNVNIRTTDNLELKKKLMESITNFINSDQKIKERWETAFNNLYTKFNTSILFGEANCIKITANEDTDEFTLDLVGCASPTSEPGAKLNFALLSLDKDKNKIECKLFKNNTTGINFSFDNKEYLDTYLVNILIGLGVGSIEKEKQKLLKSKLIESIKNFIESNTEIDPKWKELLTHFYQSYIYKKAKKDKVGNTTPTLVVDLPTQSLPLSALAGGSTKRTRRHRKQKVIKKYTRKDKKNKQRRKSKHIQKRKKTHKRKLAKLGKSRKSYKSRK